jgi:A/G-specific adenine glycosylase
MSELQQIVPDLLAWWDDGHADLPWRETRDPYAIWVAEIMLQQTQVATVVPYFERWMARFPKVEDLAAAPLKEVLKMWEGLGYYSRARNLHAAAQTIIHDFGGQLPEDVADLKKLKGVGRYTAGAIASIAFDRPVPVLDGNVIRVLSRLLDHQEDVTKTHTRNHLWGVAADLVPEHRAGDYNQALMELGQAICLPATPRCHSCPVAEHCQARAKGTQLERPVRPPRRKIPHYDVCAGVIWREDGRILIAQRPLDGLLGGLWEFPGGKVQPGESLAEALRREICEELGIEIEVGQSLAKIKHTYTHFRITLYAFQSRYLSGEPQNLEVANHAWVHLDDLDHYPFGVTDQKIIKRLLDENSGIQISLLPAYVLTSDNSEK